MADHRNSNVVTPDKPAIQPPVTNSAADHSVAVHPVPTSSVSPSHSAPVASVENPSASVKPAPVSSTPEHSVVDVDTPDKPLIEKNEKSVDRKSTVAFKEEHRVDNKRSIMNHVRPISQIITNNTVQLSYSAKKSVAQGMMDIALLTANASQLRYVLRSDEKNFYTVFCITLISISLILQIVAGIAMIYLGHYDVKKKEHSPKIRRINNWVVIFIFLITTINILIASFGPAETNGPKPAG